jgi:N-acetylglucosaminyldiphosphoundecaprenol N-acetyl-beta-D-mannosaminyltransferase
MMAKANILGVQIDLIRMEGVIEKIEQVISAGQRAVILHVHVMGLNIACEQDWFRQYLNQADLVTCDGMGVKLGARLLGIHIPQRFTLGDWMDKLAEFAQARGYSLYFLGNPIGSAEKAAVQLRDHYPKLRIVGFYHGFFDKSLGHPDNEAVVAQINTVQPDILLVGFGMPAQEKWLKENWPRLNARVGMSVGGLFEVLAGEFNRGPQWMTDHYLEWLGHLMHSPRRYWRRYLWGNPLFLYRILKQRFSGILNR